MPIRRGPSPAARLTLVVGLAAGTGALAAAPSGIAATATTTNTCQYAIDGYWRDQAFTLAGEVAPASAGPGTTVTLSGGTAQTELPAWIPQYGFNFGILPAGTSTIPATVWIAVAGTGTQEGVRVHRLSATATTTITTGAGGVFASATPIAVTVPLPDTTWTVAGDTGARIAQAPAGSLPALTTAAGTSVTPKGSLYIDAVLPGGLPFRLDCQPGASTTGGTAMTAGPAATLATVAPLVPRPVVVSPGALRTASGGVKVGLVCREAVPCTGAVTLRTSRKVAWGRTTRRVIVARGRFTLPALQRGTVKVPLTAAGRRLLAQRPRVGVTVTVAPTPGKPSSRNVSLRR